MSLKEIDKISIGHKQKIQVKIPYKHWMIFRCSYTTAFDINLRNMCIPFTFKFPYIDPQRQMSSPLSLKTLANIKRINWNITSPFYS